MGMYGVDPGTLALIEKQDELGFRMAKLEENHLRLRKLVVRLTQALAGQAGVAADELDRIKEEVLRDLG